jgi:hypothetical protein
VELVVVLQLQLLYLLLAERFIVQQFTRDIEHTIQRELLSAQYYSNDKCSDSNVLVRHIKKAFDKVCVAWQAQWNAVVFPAETGKDWRQSCTLCNMSLTAFGKKLLPFLQGLQEAEGYVRNDMFSLFVYDAKSLGGHCGNSRARRLIIELFTAAASICRGFDNFSKVCWECRGIAETEHCCGGCQVAFYCGDECQHKAWESGHKGACKQLGPKRGKFLCVCWTVFTMKARSRVCR